jgi:hypothetical protein
MHTPFLHLASCNRMLLCPVLQVGKAAVVGGAGWVLYKVVKSIPPIPVSVLINTHSASRSARAAILPRTWPNPLGSTFHFGKPVCCFQLLRPSIAPPPWAEEARLLTNLCDMHTLPQATLMLHGCSLRHWWL